jgi:hypothetical protein
MPTKTETTGGASMATVNRANTLGEQTAENDRARLVSNFVETPEYRSILETRDRCVVVGRRGTGKSAMVWKLENFWMQQKAAHVITVAPEDFQTIGFRSLFSPFASRYTLVRAAARLTWKYSFLVEMLVHLSKSFKTKDLVASHRIVVEHIKRWSANSLPLLSRASLRVGPLLKSSPDVESLIGALPSTLELQELERSFREIVDASNLKFYILIDRLDEGFENDQTGAAIISGAIGAISEMNRQYEKVRPVLFMRDNVNRAIALHDPDYTRNIEGEVLRIHWDQFQLLNLVSRRLNSVFGLDLENDQKVWDRCTADEGSDRELHGRDGFRKCLQFTLYRPRDLLSLLNEAFYVAGRENRSTIVLKDIEQTARSISETRVEDLKKEYVSVFPSIGRAIACFSDGAPEMTCAAALEKIDHLSNTKAWANDVLGQQDYQILNSEGVLRSLYGIGFVGTHDSASDTFAFCHDGRNPDKELQPSDRVLVHPCYWIGLNLTRNALTAEQAEQINDEYEIKVTSQTPVIRAARIGKIIANLGEIEEGTEGAEEFELWVENAVRTVFAGHLDNVERKPNGAATQRRDVVATNLCGTSSFNRIHSDYGSRQVIFEVKNYSDIGREEYRQMLSYLTDRYGSLGFVVTRDEDEDLHVGRELDWVREMHTGHKKLIVRLTGNFFQRLLGKLRSPEKHDVVDRSINSLLDKYERVYLGLSSSARTRPVKRKR